MKKVIYSGYCWECDGFDSDARIINEGHEYLFDDDTKQIVWTGSKWKEVVPKDWVEATDDEKHLFWNRKGFLFRGDVVTIVKGRKMVGETKLIATMGLAID